jgi:bacterioferritin (cytochrome b1)
MQPIPELVANLQSAAGMECSIQLQYHLDTRLLKRMELDGWAKHADKWGEDSEMIVKWASDDLLAWRIDPAYGVAAPRAMQGPQAVLENWLRLETAVYDFYQDAYTQALELDSNIAHDFKDFRHMHQKRIWWIERKVDQIANFGLNNYLLEALS